MTNPHTAAPDILAALEEVTRCLAWHAQMHPVGMDCIAVAKARAAIAQATPTPQPQPQPETTTGYNFATILRPWGDDQNLGTVGIDTVELYGYWERRDGTEGGGLWFRAMDDGRLELADFDGYFELPRKVVDALRGAGIVLDETFNA